MGKKAKRKETAARQRDSGVDAGAEEGSRQERQKHAGSVEPTGMRTWGSVKPADEQP